MATIDLILVLGKNSVDYYKLLRNSAELLKSNKHTIKWKSIVSHDSVSVDDIEIISKRTVFKYKHPSYIHMLCLNKAIDFVKSDYFIFCDTDVIITLKNWDDFLISHMEKNNLDLFGASNPGGHINRQQNFPSIIFMIAKSKPLVKINPDFLPSLTKDNKIRTFAISNKKESEWYGLPVGSFIKCDSCWDFSRQCKQNNIKYECMPTIRPLQGGHILRYDPTDHEMIKSYNYGINNKKRYDKYGIMCEIQYKNELIATHLSGSIYRGISSKESQIWLNSVNQYLKEKYEITIS